jgi:hypothetical protein
MRVVIVVKLLLINLLFKEGPRFDCIYTVGIDCVTEADTKNDELPAIQGVVT